MSISQASAPAAHDPGTAPVRSRRTVLALGLATGLAAGLAACATPPPPMRAAPTGPVDPRARTIFEAMQSRRIALLGEVHDNVEQHALGLLAFELLLASGARPALLLEAFDGERQMDLDRLRAYATPPGGGELLIANAGGAGWNWSLYRPFLDRAVEAGLPIVAANVSRADARRVIVDGLAAHGFDAGVPPDVESGQAALVQAAHCGAFDAATAARMARAQIARDQFMARRVLAHRERGVVLLAGNGHVRRDLGIVRWLPAETARETVAIGMLEEGDTDAVAAFDRVVVTARMARPDPCATRPVTAPAATPGPATGATPRGGPPREATPTSARAVPAGPPPGARAQPKRPPRGAQPAQRGPTRRR
jgi:uncharacterized iron-regulated protein